MRGSNMDSTYQLFKFTHECVEYFGCCGVFEYIGVK